MVRSKDLNHPVGYAATPVLTRLYGRETRPHRVAPGRGIFREASLGGGFLGGICTGDGGLNTQRSIAAG
jgi:hypothetical protein